MNDIFPGAIGDEILFAGLYKWTSGVSISKPLTIGGSAVDSEHLFHH